MPDDAPQQNDSRLNRVAENSIAKIAARYVMPLIIAAMGYLVQDKLSTISENQKAFWARIGQFNETLSGIKQDAATEAVQLHAHDAADARFQIDTDRTLADHEARLRARERGSPPP